MTDGEHTRPDPLFVPVRASQPGLICLRTGRLASGLPIGLAFTSEAALQSALGPRQQWTLICEQALLDMLAPLGIGHLRIDPRLARDAARSAPECTGQAAARPGGPAPRPIQAGTPRSSRHRSSRQRARRHRHSKHRRSQYSHHEQFRSWTPAGCAVRRWPGSVPASAPAPGKPAEDFHSHVPGQHRTYLVTRKSITANGRPPRTADARHPLAASPAHVTQLRAPTWRGPPRAVQLSGLGLNSANMLPFGSVR